MAKVQNSTTSKIGVWAFIIGIVLALLGGIIVSLIGEGQAAVTAILLVLGLIVGFFNVGKNEVKDYLIAAVSLVIVTFMGSSIMANLDTLGMLGNYLQYVFAAIMTFVIPATIIVAVKEIYGLSRN
jgi:hypothetical protein